MKKIVKGMMVILLCFSIFVVNVSGAAQFYTVKYNSASDRSDKLTSGGKIRVFYDYGTILPGDNANLFGTSQYNNRNYVGIHYANYNSSSFITDRTSTYGGTEAKLQYNPFGVNYLQPGSFVQSEGNLNSGFVMQLKVTR